MRESTEHGAGGGGRVGGGPASASAERDDNRLRSGFGRSAEIPRLEQSPPPAAEVSEPPDRVPLRRPNHFYPVQATPAHAVVGAYARNRLRQRPQPE